MSFSTLPELLLHMKKNFDEPYALSLAGDDGWTSWSTEEFYRTVVQLALGMHAYGIRKENIGLIAPSSPYWVMVDLAIMISGNVTVPVFKRISAESMQYESKDSKLHYYFIGHSGELEMVRAHGKSVKKIIPLQMTADGEDILSFNELLELGSRTAEQKPELFTELVHKVEPDDLATIIYTSGSTGTPKGVELSQSNIVSQVKASIERFPREQVGERALSSLPMAHIFERMIVYYYLASGVPVYFVDELERIGELIRDVRPTVMTVVPRLLEKVHARFWETMTEKKGLIGKLGRAALNRAENKPVQEPFRGIKDKLYNTLIYPKLREGLGGNFNQIISGASPLPEKIGRFFLNTGLPLYEGYGLTEAAPVIAANYEGHNRLGTVGPPFPGVEVRISDEGEVLARGANVMRGYHKQKKETKATIDEDGFLHTGDLGSLDEDNYLTITGRKKELFKKSTGEYVAPVPIEQKLAENRYIDMAVVIADKRKFPSALIFPDMDKASDLQKELGDKSGSMEDFLKGDHYHRAVEEVVESTNRHLHHTEEIQAFKVVPATLTVENGDLTPTMKLRRKVVEQKYSDIIENMYLEKEN